MLLWLLVGSLRLFLPYFLVDSTGAVTLPIEPKGHDIVPSLETSPREADIVILRKVLENYDNELVPSFDSKPVIVSARAQVLSVPLFQEEDLSLNLELAMEQSWVDKRLDINTSQILEVSEYMAHRLWSPHLIFYGAKKSHVHKVIYYNVRHVIHPGGKVVQTIQLSVSVQCYFSYFNFPADHRRCELKVGAGISANKIIYKWEKIEAPLKIYDGALEPQTEWNFFVFKLSEGLIESENGLNYSIITAEIVAFRVSYKIAITYLVVLTTIVCCSWAPTYIQDNFAARIISGVAILGIAVGWTGRRPHPAKLSLSCYTCIDLYSDLCLVLVSAPLFHSVAVIVTKEREKREALASQKSKRRQRRTQRKRKELRRGIQRCAPPRDHRATGRYSNSMEMKIDMQQSTTSQQLTRSTWNASKLDRCNHILSPIALLIVIAIAITCFVYVYDKVLYKYGEC